MPKKNFILLILLIVALTSAGPLPELCESGTPGITTFEVDSTSVHIVSSSYIIVARRVASTWLFWDNGSNTWTPDYADLDGWNDQTITGLTPSTSYLFKFIDVTSYCTYDTTATFVTLGSHLPIWLKGDSLMIYQVSRFGYGLYNFDLGDGYDPCERSIGDPSDTFDLIGTCCRPWDTVYARGYMVATDSGVCVPLESPRIYVTTAVESTYICLSSCEECTTCGYEYYYYIVTANPDGGLDSIRIYSPLYDTCSCAHEDSSATPELPVRICFEQHDNIICYVLPDTINILSDSLYIDWEGRWVTHGDTIHAGWCDTLTIVQLGQTTLVDICHDTIQIIPDSFYVDWLDRWIHNGDTVTAPCDTYHVEQHGTTYTIACDETLHILTDSLFVAWDSLWVTHGDTIKPPNIPIIVDSGSLYVDTSWWCWEHTFSGPIEATIFETYELDERYGVDGPAIELGLSLYRTFVVFFDRLSPNVLNWIKSRFDNYIIGDKGALVWVSKSHSPEYYKPYPEHVRGIQPLRTKVVNKGPGLYDVYTLNTSIPNGYTIISVKDTSEDEVFMLDGAYLIVPHQEPRIYSYPFSCPPDTTPDFHKFANPFKVDIAAFDYFWTKPGCSWYYEADHMIEAYDFSSGGFVHTHGEVVFATMVDLLGVSPDSAFLWSFQQGVSGATTDFDSLFSFISNTPDDVPFNASIGFVSHRLDYLSPSPLWTVDTLGNLVIWAGGNQTEDSISLPQYWVKNGLVVAALDVTPSGVTEPAWFNDYPYTDIGDKSRLYHTVSALGCGCHTIIKHVRDTVGDPCKFDDFADNYECGNTECSNTFGTSFAAPVVTALAARVAERLSSSGSFTRDLIRAIIINSATYHDTLPEPYYGFGIVNDSLAQVYIDSSWYFTSAVTVGNLQSYKFYPKSGTLKATVAWSDYEKSVVPVNDIDIWLVAYRDADTLTILPWSVLSPTTHSVGRGEDHISTFEQVFVTSIDSAVLYVRNYSGLGDIDFALAYYGTLVDSSSTPDTTSTPDTLLTYCRSCGVRTTIMFPNNTQVTIYPPDTCVGTGGQVIVCSAINSSGAIVCDTIINSGEFQFVVIDSCSGSTYEVGPGDTLFLHHCSSGGGGGDGGACDHSLFATYRIEFINTDGSADFYGANAFQRLFSGTLPYDYDSIELRVSPGDYNSFSVPEMAICHIRGTDGVYLKSVTSLADTLVVDGVTVDSIFGCGYVKLIHSKCSYVSCAGCHIRDSDIGTVGIAGETPQVIFDDSRIGEVIDTTTVCSHTSAVCTSDTVTIILFIDITSANYRTWIERGQLINSLRDLDNCLRPDVVPLYYAVFYGLGFYPVDPGEFTAVHARIITRPDSPMRLIVPLVHHDIPHSPFPLDTLEEVINSVRSIMEKSIPWPDGGNLVLSGASHMPVFGEALAYAAENLDTVIGCSFAFDIWDPDQHEFEYRHCPLFFPYNFTYTGEVDYLQVESFPLCGYTNEEWQCDTLPQIHYTWMEPYDDTTWAFHYTDDEFASFLGDSLHAPLITICNFFPVSNAPIFETCPTSGGSRRNPRFVDAELDSVFDDGAGRWGLLDSLWFAIYGDSMDIGYYVWNEYVNSACGVLSMIVDVVSSVAGSTATMQAGTLYAHNSTIGSINTDSSLTVYLDASYVSSINESLLAHYTYTTMSGNQDTIKARSLSHRANLMSNVIDIHAASNTSYLFPDSVKPIYNAADTDTVKIRSGYDLGLYSNQNNYITSPLDSLDEHNLHEHGVKDNTYHNWILNSDFDWWTYFYVNKAGGSPSIYIGDPINWYGGVLGVGVNFNEYTLKSKAALNLSQCLDRAAPLAAYCGPLRQALAPAAFTQNDSFVLSFVPLLGILDTCIGHAPYRQTVAITVGSLFDTLTYYRPVEAPINKWYYFLLVSLGPSGKDTLWCDSVYVTESLKRYFLKGHIDIDQSMSNQILSDSLIFLEIWPSHCSCQPLPDTSYGIDMVQFSTGPVVRKYALGDIFLPETLSFFACDGNIVRPGDVLPDCPDTYRFVFCDSLYELTAGDTLYIPPCALNTFKGFYVNEGCDTCTSLTWSCTRPSELTPAWGWEASKMTHFGTGPAYVFDDIEYNDHVFTIYKLVDANYLRLPPYAPTDTLAVLAFVNPYTCTCDSCIDVIDLYVATNGDPVFVSFDRRPIGAESYYNWADIAYTYGGTGVTIHSFRFTVSSWETLWVFIRPLKYQLHDFEYPRVLFGGTATLTHYCGSPCSDTTYLIENADTLFLRDIDPPQVCYPELRRLYWNIILPGIDPVVPGVYSNFIRDSDCGGEHVVHFPRHTFDACIHVACTPGDTAVTFCPGDTIVLECDSVLVSICGDSVWIYNNTVLDDSLFWCYADTYLFSINEVYDTTTVFSGDTIELGFMHMHMTCDSTDTTIDSIYVGPHFSDTLLTISSCDTCDHILCWQIVKYEGNDEVIDTVCHFFCDTLLIPGYEPYDTGSDDFGPRPLISGLYSGSLSVQITNDTVEVAPGNGISNNVYFPVGDTVLIKKLDHAITTGLGYGYLKFKIMNDSIGLIISPSAASDSEVVIGYIADSFFTGSFSPTPKSISRSLMHASQPILIGSNIELDEYGFITTQNPVVLLNWFGLRTLPVSSRHYIYDSNGSLQYLGDGYFPVWNHTYNSYGLFDVRVLPQPDSALLVAVKLRDSNNITSLLNHRVCGIHPDSAFFSSTAHLFYLVADGDSDKIIETDQGFASYSLPAYIGGGLYNEYLIYGFNVPPTKSHTIDTLLIDGVGENTIIVVTPKEPITISAFCTTDTCFVKSSSDEFFEGYYYIIINPPIGE